MMRVISIDEAYREYNDLLLCSTQYKKKSDLYDFLLLSAYYQQMLLLGYKVSDLITEHLFPTSITQDGEPFYEIIKGAGSQGNIAAIANAVHCLKTIGYRTEQGIVYKINDLESPEIIQHYESLMKLK